MNDTPGFSKAPAPAKQAPAKQSSGFGGGQQAQAQKAPRKSYQTGVGQRGPWARLSGGTPGTNQGGTTVFLFPHKDATLVSISAATWTKQGATQTPLKATVRKEAIKYENGVVKIPVWIQMKVPQDEAMAFSRDVLEASGNDSQPQAEEEIPSE